MHWCRSGCFQMIINCDYQILQVAFTLEEKSLSDPPGKLLPWFESRSIRIPAQGWGEAQD